MIERVLPRAEWPRLADTEYGPVLEALATTDAQILVVEDGATIVGRWIVLRYVHVEGVWIDPAYRSRGSVARRLLRGMRTLARDWAAGVVLTGALDDDRAVPDFIARLGGQPLPGRSFVLPVPPCR